jgi:D-threo-aldose 1-dehydrogenase
MTINYDGIIPCYDQGIELPGGKYNPRLLSDYDPDEYLNQGKNPEEKGIAIINSATN